MSAGSGTSSNRLELAALSNLITEVWRLVPAGRKYALAGASLIMLLVSAGNTTVAMLLGWLIDRIQLGIQESWEKDRFYSAAAMVLGSISLIYLARELLNVVRRYLVENACTRINRDMQIRLVDHLLRIDLSSLSRDKVGALHGKIFRSVDGLVRFIRLMFLDCLPAIFTGLFALTAALGKHPFLGLVMLGVVPLAIWLTLRQLASQKGVRLDLMRDCEEIDGTVVEQLTGAEYIRVANTLDAEVQRLSQATEKRRKREIRHHFEMSLFGCAKALNEGFFHVVVLATATYLAINQQLSFGDILTFSVLFLNIMTPLNEFHRVIDEGHEASLRVGDLLEMLRKPVDPSFAPISPAPPQLNVGEPAIVIEGLTVDYLTADGRLKRALDNISLQIRHGETIGVAGRSGSGKSTWIKALLRLIHPVAGRIWLGGIPLEQLGRAEIAQIVGYVGQNPFVFSASIHDNIRYGNGDLPDPEVVRAAELAHLHDEILSLPAGYQTPVLERGLNVSGGQRQRLAIARVLLKNSGILILDEATAALDNICERHVQRALGVANSDRTTILIAHRLTTLKDCDRILVFDQGRIVEQGEYEELILRGGLFAELVASAEAGLEESGDDHKAVAEWVASHAQS
jgi:ATP-binding cassette, subfamily B, bacterial